MPKQRSWTDDQLRAAVASSTTYADVLRKLGLTPRGRNHRNIQEHMNRLGIELGHLTGRFSRPFADDDLRAIVPSCTSYIMVVERLGLERTDTNATRVQRRITTLGIDTSHFHRKRNRMGARTRWSDDDLRAAVATSKGVAEVIRKIGLIPAGGNYVQVQRRMRELDLDTSHFLGQGWICPNCHALQATHRGLNTRSRRRQ